MTGPITLPANDIGAMLGAGVGAGIIEFERGQSATSAMLTQIAANQLLILERLGTMSATIQDYNAHLADLATAVSGITTVVGSVKAAFEGIDAAIASLRNQVAAANDRSANIASIDELKNALSAAKDNLTTAIVTATAAMNEPSADGGTSAASGTDTTGGAGAGTTTAAAGADTTGGAGAGTTTDPNAPQGTAVPV